MILNMEEGSGINPELAPKIFNKEFLPDQLDLKETKSGLESLQPGEAMFITHAGVVLNVSGIKIGLDIPSFVASPFAIDKKILLPPGKDDTLKLEADPKQSVSAFPGHTLDEVASVFSESLSFLLFTHLDFDHFSGPLYRSISKQNPELKIYGPTGTRSELLKYNSNVPSAFQEIRPRESNTVSVPVTPDNQIVLEKDGAKVTITSFETPHQSPLVEHNQSFLIDSSTGDRILYLADAALSPELLALIGEIHTKENPLTKIIVSTAKYNPTDMYKIIGEEKAKKFRDGYEEAFNHSAYLPFAIMALTESTVSIDIVHQGFYHKSVRDTQNLAYRVPISEQTPDTFPASEGDYSAGWSKIFSEKIRRTLDGMRMPSHLLENRTNSLSKLTPLTGEKKPTTFEQKIIDIDTRLRFSRRIRRWLDNFPVPQDLVESKIHMPGPNDKVETNISNPAQFFNI